MKRSDTAHWIEHRSGVIDQLERVAVAGDDERFEALRLGLGSQRRDDVVGLVVVLFQRDDAHLFQHLLNKRHLTTEFLRSLLTLGLILREDLVAEGFAGDIEGDRHVRGLFLAEDIGQHGEEAVHRVRCLTAGG